MARRRLTAEQDTCRAIVEAAGYQESDPDANPVEVAQLLRSLRSGKTNRSLVVPSTPSDMAAVSQYDSECRQLLEWQKRESLAIQTNGHHVEMPAFAESWSMDRVRHVIRQSRIPGLSRDQ